MQNKDQQNILLMAIAGIGLYLFFKKKNIIAPVVPPTTGGDNILKPVTPSPIDVTPVQPIYAPTEPVVTTPVDEIIDNPIVDVKPTPIDVIPKLTDPISDIIGITPVKQEPIIELPVYSKPEPIEPEPTLKGSIEVGVLDPGEYGDINDNFPITPLPIFDLPIFTKPEPILKGSIEVGVLDKGEYGGGGGDSLISTPSQPVYQPPIDIYIPPIVSTPELKGSIEIGPIDVGQYGPAEDMPTDTEKSPMLTSMFDNLLFNPQQSTGSGGGGGISSGGDFGGGGGSYGSGQNFLYDFIWYNPAPTLKGSIEVGNLDEGEFL
jgi:hypothetical protein